MFHDKKLLKFSIITSFHIKNVNIVKKTNKIIGNHKYFAKIE